MSNRRQWISKAEDVADEVFRRSKAILPTIARLCLVSTFIEDGLHIRLRWSQGRNYMDKRWGHELATLFVSINMLSQLIASGLELTRYHVTIACGLLFCVVGLRTLTFGAVWNPLLWPWALNLCGALLLLLAECQTEAPTLLAGVPSDEQNRPKAYLLFTGRILTLLIFFTSLSLELRDMENVFLIIRKVIVLVLVVAVTIGYKTKPSALLLVVWLTAVNSYTNPFWTIDSNKAMFDREIKHFFVVLSVIGGLLMIVVLGPGDLSVDNYKKNR